MPCRARRYPRCEVTATYVASEFQAYGLKTAPGMTDISSARRWCSRCWMGTQRSRRPANQPGTKLEEGQDFHLLMCGQPVNGRSCGLGRRTLPWVPPGAVVVLQHRGGRRGDAVLRPLYGVSAAVLMEENA
jgi:hypothetical protein